MKLWVSGCHFAAMINNFYIFSDDYLFYIDIRDKTVEITKKLPPPSKLAHHDKISELSKNQVILMY